MGRVTCFQVPGLSLWFNTNDHGPPHFHAEHSGEWEVRIYFLLDDPARMVEQKWGRSLSRQHLRALVRQTEEHRAQLLQEWQEKVLLDR